MEITIIENVLYASPSSRWSGIVSCRWSDVRYEEPKVTKRVKSMFVRVVKRSWVAHLSLILVYIAALARRVPGNQRPRAERRSGRKRPPR